MVRQDPNRSGSIGNTAGGEPDARGPAQARDAARVALAAAIGLVVAAPPALAASPVASDVTSLTRPETVTTITLSATDGDSDPLDYIIVTLPSGDTVKVGGVAIGSGDLPYTIPANGNTLTYTSAASTHGAITFTYKANDGANDSNTATITVTVNQLPVPTAATVTTEPDEDLDITLAGTDADDDTLSFTIVTLAGHGVLEDSSTTLIETDLPYALGSSTSVTYTPDASFHGQDSFTFKAADTYETGTVTATITIQVNTAPTVESVTKYISPDTATEVSLLGTDADRDPISYIVLSIPANGTLRVGGSTIDDGDLPYTVAGNGSSVEYTPTTGYLGTDSIHYKATDGIEESELGVISMIVNAPPVGASDTATTDDTGQATVMLTATDADGDALEVTFATLPTHGELTAGGQSVTDTTTAYEMPVDTGLTVTYQVEDDYEGTDVLAWTVTDAKVTSGPYQVTITIPVSVSSASDAPPADDSGTSDTSGTSDSGTSDSGASDSGENSSSDASTDDASSDDADSSELTNPYVDPCGDMGFFGGGAIALFSFAGMVAARRRGCA